MRPVALVTGGAARVGRALSVGLAAAGYDLAINYRSSTRAAEHLLRELDSAGHEAVLAPGDVSDEEEVRGILQRVEDRFGRLDLVVNNASTFLRSDLLSTSVAEWDRVMAVNVRGPFLVVRESASLLTRSEGSVVNIVDLSAFQPWIDYPHHSVSKAALLHLTRVMARALAPGVRVNAVAPGTVLPPEDYSAEAHQRDVARTALGRIGEPEDVLRAVLFLARSPFVTGEVIVVDGGRLLQG